MAMMRPAEVKEEEEEVRCSRNMAAGGGPGRGADWSWLERRTRRGSGGRGYSVGPVTVTLRPADIETPPTRQTTQHLELQRRTQHFNFPSAILPTAMVFGGASTFPAVLVDDFLCFVFSSLWGFRDRLFVVSKQFGRSQENSTRSSADRHHLTRTAMSTKLRLRSREEDSQKPLRIREKGGGSGRTIYRTWRRRPYGGLLGLAGCSFFQGSFRCRPREAWSSTSARIGQALTSSRRRP